MPELPDVEGFRRVLEKGLGRRIERVDILDPGVLRDGTARDFHRALAGAALTSPRRHGKWLVAPLAPPRRRHRANHPSLLFHFGMTGALAWVRRDDTDRHRHDRLVVVTNRGELRYNDMRKLQGVRLARDDDRVDDILDDLGPDAEHLSAPDLRQRLQGNRGQVKPALIDQTAVAGLGNLLADETLWRARIHPKRPVPDLTYADYRRLHGRLRTVLRHSIPAGRVLDRSSWLTGRRDDPDGTCPRCGSHLSRTRVSGRSTLWCPCCQPA